MEWKYIKSGQFPLATETGYWDGRKSNQVIAEDKNGKKYLASYYEGILDGSEFKDWADSNDYTINVPIVRWLEIPY